MVSEDVLALRAFGRNVIDEAVMTVQLAYVQKMNPCDLICHIAATIQTGYWRLGVELIELTAHEFHNYTV